MDITETFSGPKYNLYAIVSDNRCFVQEFMTNLDPYPMHWLMHFLHACEIVGYKHSDRNIRDFWSDFYYRGCAALHMLPESEHLNDLRLSDEPEVE